MIYRTDDATRWGVGKGANLTALEVDLNFWEIAQRLLAVEGNPAKPAEISNIQVIGTQMTIFLSDGRSFGPYTLPSAMIRYRGDWTAGAAYSELDIVLVPNDGVYLVVRAHTAAATFSASAVNAAGEPLYRWLFPSRAAGVAEAPSDGILYGRLNAAWVQVPAAPTWETLAGKPATFPPSAHTHLWADLTDKPTTFPPSAHSHPWGEVTGRPATVDALPATLGTAGQVIKVNGTATGLVWAADDTGTGGATNLDGLSDVVITAPALGQVLKFDGTSWVNGTDEGGTGSTTLDGLSDVAIVTPAVAQVLRHNGTEWVNTLLGWADIGGKPATFPPDAHTHPWGDVTGRPATINAIPAALGAAGQVMKVDAAGTGLAWAADDSGSGGATNLDGLSDVAIVTPAVAQTLRFDGTQWANAALGWADVAGKPATFPPSAHTHPWAEVTGRPATIDALPATVGTDGQVLKAGANGTIVWGTDKEGTGGGGTTTGLSSGDQIGAHKYWRMEAYASYGAPVSGNAFSVFTLEFRFNGVEHDKTGGVVIGPGITNPSSAFDGSNTSNATAAAYPTDGSPLLLGYQFANAVSVDTIRVGTYFPGTWGPATPALYDISFSDDGVTYTKAVRIDERGKAVPEYNVLPVPTEVGQELYYERTANYTLVNQDLVNRNTIEMNSASANTVTIPAGLTRKGAPNIVQLGAGQTSIVAGAGVTLRAPHGLKLSKQFSRASIIPRGGDVYYIRGDLVV